MYTKYFAGVSVLLMLLAATGCCKKKIYCPSGKMSIVIANYNRSESRSISIKRYKIGEHVKALDSGTLVYNKTLPTLKPGEKDTLNLSDYFASSYAFTGIRPGNDWLIYLPAVRESYLITTLDDNGHRNELVACGDNNTTCVADVAHFSINFNWLEGNTAWIVKPVNK